jgi:ADP-ribosylglycohydrolase
MSKKIKTTVVCLKGQKGQELEEDQVYIGRKMSQGGWNLPSSDFANPYKGRNPVAAYYRWLMEDEQKDLRKKMKKNLKGKMIACWCYNSNDPKEGSFCHGDAIIAVTDDVINYNLERVLKEEEELFQSVKEQREVFNTIIEEMEPLSYQDRIVGMFTAAFMGDTKGSLYEFGKEHPEYEDRITERLTIHGNRYNKDDTYSYGLGQVTDDSEMAIVLAGHLVEQYEIIKKKKKLTEEQKKNIQIDAEKLAVEYMTWCNSSTSAVGKNTRELFGGVKTLKGYNSHFTKKFGFEPSYNEEQEFQSEPAENQLSNGSLMRCFSLALLPDNSLIYRDIYLTNPSSIVEEMEKDYVSSLRKALQGESAEDILTFFLRKKKSRSTEYQSVINDIKNGEKRTLTNKKSKNTIVEGKGSAMSFIYAVIWSLFYLVNGYKINSKKKTYKNVNIFDIYQSLIEDFPGSDTDTNCTGAGALIGTILGYKTMSKDEDYIYNCDLIFDIEQETDRPRDNTFHPSRLYFLLPSLLEMYETYNNLE